MKQAPSPSATIHSVVKAAARRFESVGIATSRLDAEVLMRHVLGLDRTAYFLARSGALGDADRATFHALVARRASREPIAYLTGSREFMGRPFAVGPGVLVPRPETEILVEWALGWLASHAGVQRVTEAGTGSGAIALSIAAETWPGVRHQIVAGDISEAALRFAARNRASLGMEAAVTLVRGKLADWHGGPIDLLLANLPYLRSDQVTGNLDLAAEPELALVGGQDGLDLVRLLLADTPRLLTSNGAIGLEIDPSQAEAAVEFGQRHLPALDWRVIPDLAGFSRHVVGTAR